MGATGSSSFTLPMMLGDGRHEVKAQATDASANVGPFSLIHAFTVDTLAPGVPAVLAPAQGAVLSTGAPDITGTAEPGSTVSILVGDIVIGTAPVGSSGGWIFIPPAPFTEGTWSV